MENKPFKTEIAIVMIQKGGEGVRIFQFLKYVCTEISKKKKMQQIFHHLRLLHFHSM